MKETVYLKHPCSLEDKKKWNKRGYKVADLKFAPKGYKNPDQVKASEKRKTKKAQ